MAEQPQPNALASTYPSPPPFYEHFTTENLERIAALCAAEESQSGVKASDGPKTQEEGPTAQTSRILDLPPELRFLQRPALPADGIYRSFGDIFNLNEGLPSLVEQGIEQLYSSPTTPSADGTTAGTMASTHSDRALVLKRIAKSLLLNFLELMGIMSVNPEQYMEKIQDLRTLFINFHHLLNEYRPHQARESLIMMMEEQLDRCRAETEGVERMKVKVEGILKGLGQVTVIDEEGDAEKAGCGGVTGDHEVEPIIWEELEKKFS